MKCRMQLKMFENKSTMMLASRYRYGTIEANKVHYYCPSNAVLYVLHSKLFECLLNIDHNKGWKFG